MNHTTPALDGEPAADYTRRTGHYPPHWSFDRCAVQDARIRDLEHAAAMGVTAADRKAAQRALCRWGTSALDGS